MPRDNSRPNTPAPDGPDPRNTLNDLPNRRWLQETKSFRFSQGGACAAPGDGRVWEQFVGWLRDTRAPEEVEALLGQYDDSFVFSKAPPRSKLKALHPATFSEADVERLIRMFTKAGERVLDPFVGSGSTLIACAQAGRHGVGIELSEDWADVARRRIRDEAQAPRLDMGDGAQTTQLEVIVGDAREALDALPPDSFDFIVTSPPYWSILTKKAGLKAQAERKSRGLPTHYSDSVRDLGNIEDYEQFLAQLGAVFGCCLRVLRPRRYMAVIVSDFRHGPRFYLYHADLAARIEQAGFALKGLTILAQDNKNLYPFGIPNHFVSNIHHQYILVSQRQE